MAFNRVPMAILEDLFLPFFIQDHKSLDLFAFSNVVKFIILKKNWYLESKEKKLTRTRSIYLLKRN